MNANTFQQNLTKHLAAAVKATESAWASVSGDVIQFRTEGGSHEDAKEIISEASKAVVAGGGKATTVAQYRSRLVKVSLALNAENGPSMKITAEMAKAAKMSEADQLKAAKGELTLGEALQQSGANAAYNLAKNLTKGDRGASEPNTNPALAQIEILRQMVKNASAKLDQKVVAEIGERISELNRDLFADISERLPDWQFTIQ